MNLKAGASNFFLAASAPQAYTPLSDVTDASGSSYDDGPAENGSNRDFPVTEQRLYVINRCGTGEASYLLLTEDARRILSYRVHTERWRVTEGLMHFGAVVLGTYIYIIGGFHRGRAVCLNRVFRGRAVYRNRVFRYDACETEWTECSSMLQARAKFGACVLDGKIYVCGGERSDGKLTASTEVYDPDTDTWTKCGMLLAPRANCACTGYGKELLCAGGFQGGAAHNNLWIYERHRWQEMDEHYPHRLPYNLDKCAIATVGNTFFFIGVPSASRSPERSQRKVRFHTQRKVFSYTVQISAGEKIRHGQQPDLISPWNLKLPPMIHARHSAGAVAIGHKIHVVGGTSVETGQMVQVSETFDLRKGIWEEDFTLRKCDVSNVCCVLLEVPKIPPSERANRYRLRWVMW
ncbi:hypothetical protein EGW08_011789 [Elysia chlorotica]|uniref:Uncharacterized protein n=1 Tax=Elysia chlorotica TaxID=188477 RepID=A0A3S1BBW3_ELYCH|nr:hypothetical protein EGW08_011789 [Elysia chlorotica]